MNQATPTQYESNSNLQKEDTKYFLEKYGHLIKLNKDDSILDVGCGDGFVTTHILGQFLGQNYNELVGIDKNEKMIQHADQNYGCGKNGKLDSKIKFKILDITTKKLPLEIQRRFNHVFSFYCLHWVFDLSLSLKNIRSMLKKDGDILCYFVCYHPYFAILKKLSKYVKYAPYMKSANRIMPYIEYKHKEEWCKNMFKENGFKVNVFEVIERNYSYPSLSKYKECAKALNSFKIADSLCDDFYEDVIKEARKMGNVFFENGNEIVRDKYQLFVVLAENA